MTASMFLTRLARRIEGEKVSDIPAKGKALAIACREYAMLALNLEAGIHTDLVNSDEPTNREPTNPTD